MGKDKFSFNSAKLILPESESRKCKAVKSKSPFDTDSSIRPEFKPRPPGTPPQPIAPPRPEDEIEGV